jgi:hypothetical protein
VKTNFGFISGGKHMRDRIAFRYWDFHDFPRMIELETGGQCYLLDSPYDEIDNKYLDYYGVSLIPLHWKEEMTSNSEYWCNLTEKDYLGRIPIAELGLDDTRRNSIDGRAFEEWLSAHRK